MATAESVNCAESEYGNYYFFNMLKDPTLLSRVFQTVKKASQSLRPQTQIRFNMFFPATCASEKTLISLQTCELCVCNAQ